MNATLKTNLNRTVRLAPPDPSSPERHRVIKRFHSPGPLRRLTDGRRARHEFRVLQRLHVAGFPVPEPLDLRRERGRWEVVTALIEGACSLDEVLRGEHPWPIHKSAIAKRLAQLLARLYAIGLDHRDLHAGNVLLTRDGEPWLIDFQHARLDRRVDASLVTRDLIQLTAAVREHASTRFRAVFLRELSGRLNAMTLPPRAELAELVEQRGRELRRHRVGRRSVRWMRESGICRVTELGFVRRDIDDAQAARLLELARENGSGFDHAGKRWIPVKTSAASSEWRAAARLDDHALPVARPALYASPLAVFELPAGARSISPSAMTGSPSAMTGAMFLSLAGLIGALHDRGLVLSNVAASDYYARDDEVLFGTGCEVMELTQRRRLEQWRELEQLAVDTPRPALLAAYLNAQSPTRVERARLIEELSDV